jgi:hypothetical protein
LALWQQLASEVRPLPDDFDRWAASPVIVGDINRFVQKTWSARRLRDAMEAFSGAALVHDIANPNSVVHSEYINLQDGDWSDLILTHSPDEFVSEIPLMVAGMKLVVEGGEFREIVNGNTLPMNADYFVKWARSYFVGLRDPAGRWGVRSAGPNLRLVPDPCALCTGDERIELSEYLEGRYYPVPVGGGVLRVRMDGKAERLVEKSDGSRGTIVEDIRSVLFPEDRSR